MKKILIPLLLLCLTSCAGKYIVVQKLRVNLYHLQNLKTKEGPIRHLRRHQEILSSLIPWRRGPGKLYNIF